MARTEKRPPIKETLGSMSYCFDTPDEGESDYTGNYESNVTYLKTAKSAKVTENGDSSPVYASGEEYATVNAVSSIDNEIESVAFPAEDLAKMRGDAVSETGLIVSGASSDRPFFAWGKTVKLRGGKNRYVWYPKCRLTSNTDDTSTKEESFSEQNDTVTIRAYPFDDAGNIFVEANESIKTFEGLTEDKFFSTVIRTDADFKKILGKE